MCFKGSLVLYFTGLIAVAFAGTPWNLNLDVTIKDKITTEGLLSTISASTLSRCAVECHVISSCITIGYIEQTRTCHMFSKEVTTLDASYFEDTSLSVNYYKPTCYSGFLYVKQNDWCVKLFIARQSYENATTTCADLGARIIFIQTQQHLNYFFGMVDNENHHYWLGGRNGGSDWYWSDGSKINSTNGGQLWLPGEPGSNSCLETNFRSSAGLYGIQDEDCSIIRKFYCQYV